MQNRLVVWVMGCLTLLLAACTGGAGGEATSSPAAGGVLQGRFIDSAVIGMFYKTETKSGYTGVSGDFSFTEGQTIQFSIDVKEKIYVNDAELPVYAIKHTRKVQLGGQTVDEKYYEDLGDIVFPKVSATTLVTPLTLAQQDLTHPSVANMAYLLQSLDSDGNPSNGIVIGQGMAKAAAAELKALKADPTQKYTQLDFNVETNVFVNDPLVKALIKAKEQLTNVPNTTTPDGAVEDLAKNVLGALDSDPVPASQCASVSATIVGVRSPLSANLWADLYAKPQNSFGWFHDSVFQPRGGHPLGNFTLTTVKANSPEALAASLSDHWDSAYSMTKDMWLKHASNDGVKLRIAARKNPAESKAYPGYVGTAIYLHYVGQPGSYLELVLGSQDAPTVFYSYTSSSAEVMYYGTAGKDGIMQTGDDGYYANVKGEGWINHQPAGASGPDSKADVNFPPNMRLGASTPNGRQLPVGNCLIKSGGSVLLWTRPSNRVDFFFSPVSARNRWGWTAPLYTDELGYEGSVGIREGTNKLNIVSKIASGL